MTAATLELDPGALTALVHTYELDGRVSWHDPSLRGFAPINCYLLDEEGGVLLCDTGLTVHREALLAQLRERGIGEGELAIFLLRQGEFDSMCNLDAIVREFGVREIYGQYADAPGWAHVNSASELPPAVPEPTTIVPDSEVPIPVGGGRERSLEVFVPALRLLGTYWAYDARTETLFSSDSFTYVTRPDDSGPWVVTESDDDVTTIETICDHLLSTRYWWLTGAFVGDIRADLARIFATHRIARIAPAYGCILEGERVVERHLSLLDEALGRLGLPVAPQAAPVGTGGDGK